jgi:hypothetical protein
MEFEPIPLSYDELHSFDGCTGMPIGILTTDERMYGILLDISVDSIKLIRIDEKLIFGNEPPLGRRFRSKDIPVRRILAAFQVPVPWLTRKGVTLPLSQIQAFFAQGQIAGRIRLQFLARRLLEKKAIYVDWDWLQRNSGGIRSLGVGFTITGTVGWHRSLFGQFWKKMNGLPIMTVNAIQIFPQQKEFILKVDQVRVLSKIRKRMEGHRWSKAILRDGAAQIPAIVKENDTFQVPPDRMKTIGGPLHVWGEMLPSQTIFSRSGNVFVIKIRGIACV